MKYILVEIPNEVTEEQLERMADETRDGLKRIFLHLNLFKETNTRYDESTVRFGSLFTSL